VRVSKPEVSVLCIAYNQEEYIRDALEGFLAQKTSFSFEIIVHDDASTDSTADIIRDYESRFPSVIKGIYEEENQFSLKRNIVEIMLPYAKGDFVALCEGDDFWISNNKLQSQVDYMLAHPDCSACVHQAQVIDCRTGKISHFIGYGNQDRDIFLSDMVRSFHFQTASLLIRKDLEVKYHQEWTFPRPFGDYPRAIFLAFQGYVHYDAAVMSCYRFYAKNSWTVRQENLKTRIETRERMFPMLFELDIHTGYTCHDKFMQYCCYCGQEMVKYKGFKYFSVIKESSYAPWFTPFDAVLAVIKRFLFLMGFIVESRGSSFTLRRVSWNSGV
jgi:glycosyltransferase involved in cell wall biosynthesis